MTYLGRCHLTPAPYSPEMFISCLSQESESLAICGSKWCEWEEAEALDQVCKSHSLSVSPTSWTLASCDGRCPWCLQDGVTAPCCYAPTMLSAHPYWSGHTAGGIVQIVLCPFESPVPPRTLLGSNSRHAWWINGLIPKIDLSLTWSICFYYNFGADLSVRPFIHPSTHQSILKGLK